MSFVPPAAVVAEILFSGAADIAAVHQEIGQAMDTWQIELGNAGFPDSSRLVARVAPRAGADSAPTGLGPSPWGAYLGSQDLSAVAEAARVRRELDSRLALVRALVARCPVLAARIGRVAPLVLPAPPHAFPQDVLVIADRAEIERDYLDPEVYWQAWDPGTEVGAGRMLLTRALAVEDEIAYKRHIWASTWAMARAARPGLTRYHRNPASELHREEQHLLDGGTPTLTPLGYDPQERWLEFTAWIPSDGDAHILPREIFMLHELVARRQFEGQPLQSVRVTFIDRATAEREARPLQDCGIRVLFLGEDGDWQMLEA